MPQSKVRGPRCADCDQLLVDKFHTGVFFHVEKCGAEFLREQDANYAAVGLSTGKMLAIADFSEQDEMEVPPDAQG